MGTNAMAQWYHHSAQTPHIQAAAPRMIRQSFHRVSPGLSAPSTAGSTSFL